MEGDSDEPTRPQSLPPPPSRKSTTWTRVSKRTVAEMVSQHSHLTCPHHFSDVLAPGTLNTDPDFCCLSTCIFTDGVGGSDHRSPGEGGLRFSRHKGLEAQSMNRTLNGSSELPKPKEMHRAALQEHKVKTARSTLAGAKPTPSLRLAFGDVVGETALAKWKYRYP